MTMRLVSAVALAATLLAGCVAPGGTPRERQPRLPLAPAAAVESLLFVEFDQDADRRVTRAELAAGAAREWAAVSQGRARIGVIDLQRWMRATVGAEDGLARFTFDPDADGDISEADFLRALSSRFAALDANNNGALTREELYKRAPALPEPTDPRRPPGRPPQGAPPPA